MFTPRVSPILLPLLALVTALLAPPLAAQSAWTVTRTNIPGVNFAQSVAFGNGRFVATVSNLNTPSAVNSGSALSTDGITWRASSTRTPAYATVVFAAGYFYLVDSGALWRSTDGDTWVNIRHFFSQSCSLATDGHVLFAVRSSGGVMIAQSMSDVGFWSPTTTLPGTSPWSNAPNLAVAHNRYYARYYLPTGDFAVASSDAVAWSQTPRLPTSTYFAGGNGRIVGIGPIPGGGTTAFSSTDGITFVDTTINGSLSNGGTLGYAGGRFFLLGSLSASFDGAAWAPLAPYSGNQNGNMTGIAYGNGRYVAVGHSGGNNGNDVVAVLAATAPPSVTAQPLDRTVAPGASATFSVAIENTQLATTYQWLRNGAAIAGATTASYTIDSVKTTDLGRIGVVLRNAIGTVTSAAATLAFLAPPTITGGPQNLTVSANDSPSFFVTATGAEPFTYQWFRNGSPIPGATNRLYSFAAPTPANHGQQFSVTVTNAVGSATSYAATLTFRSEPPSVLSSTAPTTPTLLAGDRATFSVTLSGTAPFTIQWQRSGQPIPGATSATFVLDPVLPSDTGSYQATISNSAGTIYSPPSYFIVTPVSRISNLSVLTSLSSPADNFTLGFVVGGAGTVGDKPFVVRAVGPALSTLGVAGPLDDPTLATFAGSAPTGENDNWGGATALSNAFAAVGAFPFASPTSRDAAVLTSLTTRDNSVRVAAASTGTGLVLAEVYDASSPFTFTTTTPRLLNVSVLKSIGSGLTVGFTIFGTRPKQVLIRAIGPTLAAAPFNVAGAIADPELRLFSGSSAIATNDNWSGTPTLTTAFATVGAFALPANSHDAALLTTLPPGGYSVQVSGVANTTGTALVEVYEVP